MVIELTDHRKKLFQRQLQSLNLNENSKYIQIASLIPDEVIQNPNNTKVRSFGASIIFADISGFTDMSDKYQYVDNGASKLSAVLNFYLGIMVQEILSHNGDVLKYAGDAFLAIFKAENEVSYQLAVQKAIDSCIVIQKSCRNFTTEIGVVLNVKIAISCGSVHFSLIGNEQLSHYVIVGEPIWQVKSLQDFIVGGEILVTSSAWFFAQNSLYTYEYMREHRCYKIKGFRDQTNMIRQQFEVMTFREKDISNRSESNTGLETSFDPYTYNLRNVQEERFTVRHTVAGNVIAEESKNFLRRFIIAPLLNAIDIGDGIDQLTEMRQVVILFANFVVPDKNPMNICKITDKIFTQLNRYMHACTFKLDHI
jgi:adenylate cyclase 10